MSELTSSPNNEKPTLDGLFPELKRSPASMKAPRFMGEALAASALLSKAPTSQRFVPPPPSIRSKSAPPPAPPKSMQLQVVEEVEAVEIVSSPTASPIVAQDDAYTDDGPTILRSSPLMGPPISARPPLSRPSAPVATQPSAAPVPPSRRMAAPPSPSQAKLPPLPTPPPSLRSTPKPSAPAASAPKLPPLPTPPPSALRNAAPPSPPPTSAPIAAPPSPAPTSTPIAAQVDDEAETLAPPEVNGTERKRDSFAPAAQLMAPLGNRYVPPSAPPKPARPLSALETIPASRYHSLAPQVMSQSVPPPAPAPRRFGLLFAAAATLGLAAVAGFFTLGGAHALGLGAKTGALAVTASGPGSSALDGVRVLVDGTVACESSPCELGELSAGTHFVTVEAKGFATTAARAVSVERNGTATLDVQLVPDTAAAPAATKVEEPVKAQEPVKAETAKAEEKATSSAPAEPKAQASKSSALPERNAKTERAEKKDDAQKTAAAAKEKEEAAKKTATAEPAAAMGTLNINSIPVANVVLDGRPMGSTPLIGLSVSPGPHSVVFIHPEKGRKASGTTVKAGATSTVAVRF